MVDFSILEDDDDAPDFSALEVKEERVRPSNPFRQGAAGLTDVATGLPMVLGMAGTGIGTLFDRDDDPETGYGQEFVQNLATNPVFNFGARGRQHVNEFLGIEEPISIEDQGARLLTSLAIPGMGPLAALSKGGALANVARLATPVVKITPGATKANVARLGLQGGLGLGIDQGVREIMQAVAPDSPGAVLNPPIFSESALKGVEASKHTDAMAALGLGPNFSALEVNPTAQEALDQDAAFSPELADLDRQARKEGIANTVGNSLIAAGVTAATIYALRRSAAARQAPSQMGLLDETPVNPVKEAVNKIRTDGIEGAKEVASDTWGAAASKVRTFNEGWVNSDARIKRELMESGVSEKHADDLIGQGITDSFGSVMETIRDGVFVGTGNKTIPLKDILRKYEQLDEGKQAIFNDGIVAVREDIIRDTATRAAREAGEEIEEGTRVMPGLWTKSGRPITDDEIAVRINQLRDDPELMQMAKDIAKINDDILSEAVARGMKSSDTAARWRDDFRTDKLGVNKDGDALLFYIPGMQIQETKSWWTKLKEYAGIHSTKSEELTAVEQWQLKALGNREGTLQPVDPMRATADYMFHAIDAINKNNAQANILTRLANIDIDPSGNVIVKGTPMTENVRWIGMADRDPGTNRGQGDLVWSQKNIEDPKASKELGFGEESTDVNKFFNRDDIMVVERGGKQYAFHVQDPHLKIAMKFSHKLTTASDQFLNQWKNNFTQLTTGNLSVFAPTSFLYNQQLATVNAFSKFGAREGMRTWLDGFKGAYEMFAVNTARDVSDILSRNMEQGNGFFVGMAPDLVARINERLQRRISNSMLVPIQRESGKLATSLSSSEYSGNLTNILETAVPHLSQRYGANALPLVWRLWNNINSAMHEGVALGRIMREVEQSGKTVTDAGFDQLVRRKTKVAKDLVGDVTKRGTSSVAKTFHAATPFSGAMFQAWATLGGAMKKNPGKFAMALGATVALPTASEVAWNNLIDPDAVFDDVNGATDPETGQLKQWSYKDYYWNGFTTQQRNDNLIMFIPGKPPWEALIVPISPEFTLVRSIMIEGMDELFGMSNIGNSGESGDNGDHWMAALSRVFEIPLPPPASAIVSGASGHNLRLGFNPSFKKGDGEGWSLFSSTPVGVARVVVNSGVNKNVGDEFDAKMRAAIYDLFGAGAATSIGMYEAFFGGRDDKPQAITDRVSHAFGKAGESLRKQARWTQPLFGKALSPNHNDEIASEVAAIKDSLKRMTKARIPYDTQGGALNLSGASIGDTVAVSNDPVYNFVMKDAQTIMDSLKPYDKEISRMRTSLSTLENAYEFEVNGVVEKLTAKRRRDISDSLKLEISTYKSKQLAWLKTIEEHYSKILSDKLGRDVNVKLSGLQPRDL